MYYLLFLVLLTPILYFNQNNIKRIYTLSTITKKNKGINKYKTILSMLKITFTFAKVLLYQKLNKNVINLGNNKYQLQFIINNRLVKLNITYKYNANILQIIDDNDNDITHIIEPFFQNIELKNDHCPMDFDYHKLTFETMDGDEHTFESDDKIELD